MGSQETSIEEECLKRQTWTVCWFKRGLARKRGWCFWGGDVDTPMHTMIYLTDNNKRFITRLILVGGSTALHSMPCLFCMLAIFLKPVLCGHFSILLKLVSAIFFQIFIFHCILQKLWKMFFILSKKLFSFLRYLNFCIFVFPSFFPCQSLL